MLFLSYISIFNYSQKWCSEPPRHFGRGLLDAEVNKIGQGLSKSTPVREESSGLLIEASETIFNDSGNECQISFG